MRKYTKSKYIQQFTVVPNTGPVTRPYERKKERKEERQKKKTVLIEFRLRREVWLTNVALYYITTLWMKWESQPPGRLRAYLSLYKEIFTYLTL